MKNIKKVFLLMLFVPFCMSAQTKRYYCEIKGTERELSSKMKIIFDFGQNSSYNIWSNLNHKMEFVDNEGKVIDFNSMVDAMNYMSERGWKFLQAYSTYRNNSPAIEHWILYKDANSKEEAREGILTKEDFN
jgi:hypothetical protein